MAWALPKHVCNEGICRLLEVFISTCASTILWKKKRIKIIVQLPKESFSEILRCNQLFWDWLLGELKRGITKIALEIILQFYKGNFVQDCTFENSALAAGLIFFNVQVFTPKDISQSFRIQVKMLINSRRASFPPFTKAIDTKLILWYNALWKEIYSS